MGAAATLVPTLAPWLYDNAHIVVADAALEDCVAFLGCRVLLMPRWSSVLGVRGRGFRGVRELCNWVGAWTLRGTKIRCFQLQCHPPEAYGDARASSLLKGNWSMLLYQPPRCTRCTSTKCVCLLATHWLT